MGRARVCFKQNAPSAATISSSCGQIGPPYPVGVVEKRHPRSLGVFSSETRNSQQGRECQKKSLQMPASPREEAGAPAAGAPPQDSRPAPNERPAHSPHARLSFLPPTSGPHWACPAFSAILPPPLSPPPPSFTRAEPIPAAGKRKNGLI